MGCGGGEHTTGGLLPAGDLPARDEAPTTLWAESQRMKTERLIFALTLLGGLLAPTVASLLPWLTVAARYDDGNGVLLSLARYRRSREFS